MSSDNVAAKRYARALFEAAQARNDISAVSEELKVVVDLLESDDDFRQFLFHPNIASTNKVDVIKKAFGSNISEIVFNALQLLIRRKRESMISALYDNYLKIADEALGQAAAIVYTPFALNDKDSQDIAQQFSRITGKKISIENVVDTALIGGARVRIGDRLYDGSIAGKLNQLENLLKRKAF